VLSLLVSGAHRAGGDAISGAEKIAEACSKAADDANEPPLNGAGLTHNGGAHASIGKIRALTMSGTAPEADIRASLQGLVPCFVPSLRTIGLTLAPGNLITCVCWPLED